jgi:4,5-dihydroxyphthalate decarboxylase
MTKLRLSIGFSHYDHVWELTAGRIPLEGLELNHLELTTEEIFQRFIVYREWDVSELSLAKHAAMVSQGDTSVVGIPVFPSRMFRHSAIYVRADSGLEDPSQFAGARIGVPEWAQTASVYLRAMLAEEYGVDLSRVQWFQAGTNQPGRREKVRLNLPPTWSYTSVPDRSLSDMLLAGDVEAILCGRPPDCYLHHPDQVVRMFPDFQEAERAYWARSGIFPIMHDVVVRRELVEAHPWLPMTLFKGFEEAKRRSFARLVDVNVSRYPVPWLQTYAQSSWDLFQARDPWPYGVEGNRPTLEAFLRHAYDQGVLEKALEPEQLFAPSVAESYRV